MKLNVAVIKSIIGSIVFKAGTAFIAFFSVPVLLKILGTNDYGLWVTLTALVGWLNLFDFGSGYSLKNKVTESLVKDDRGDLQVLVAGTIQFYLLSTFVILIVFAFSLYFLQAFRQHLGLTCILYLPVILSFPLTVGHFIIQGLKKFNLFNSLLLAQSFLWLLTILLFKYNIILSDIYVIAVVYSVLYVLVNFSIFYFSLYTLNFRWRELLDFNHFKSSKASLMVGGKFFLLQISSLMLFSIGNIMTYNNLQLKDVAQFDTVNKIFTMAMLFFNVLISVFWAEISHAKALQEKIKLTKMYQQLLAITAAFVLGTVAVSFFTPTIITMWTKGVISVTLKQLIPFILLTTIQSFSYVGAVFLNAFEDLSGQVIYSVISAILIIPVAKYLFYLNFGIGSVPLASAIVCSPTLFYLLYKAKACITKVDITTV
jgi:O-antigen/teichoic acid export membrane protein